MKKYVEPYSDSINYDTLGSLIAQKKGNGDVRIMIAGHVDEIGFLVSKIDEEGYLRLHPIGGWWPHVLLSQRFHVFTAKGKKFVGVIGSQAPHGMSADARAKVKEIKDLYLDIGVDNKKAVEDLGIRPGDAVVPISEFTQLANPKYWLAKAFDDRLGAAAAVEVLKNLQNENHPNTVFAVGTVQEEVGLRGARTSAHAVKPDIAFAIDVTLAGDVPGSNTDAKLGKGVAISFADSSVIGHKGLIDELIQICQDEKIPYTFDVLAGGGTDAGEIHKFGDGVIACTLSIPARYIHSHNGVIHEDDYNATIRLLTAFVKKCDRTLLNKLKISNR